MNLFLLVIFVISTAWAKDHRSKVVVIDTGVGWHQYRAPFMCENGSQTTVPGSDVYDGHDHGTNIIGIISRKLDYTKFCIYSIKYTNDRGDSRMSWYLDALEHASKLSSVAIVNLSLEGDSHSHVEEFYVNLFIKKNIIVVAAAGNKGLNLNVACHAWPACLKQTIKSKRFIVVTTTDLDSSSRGSIVTHKRSGKNVGFPRKSGTSQATAILTSELCRKR